MKRIRPLILSLVLVLLFCACGTNDIPETKGTTLPPTAENPTAEPSTELQTDLSTAPPAIPVISGKPVLGEGKTYTGRAPMPMQEFKVNDPENAKGLSTAKKGYGYGVATGGKPHSISVGNQNYFETNAYRAFCLDTKSQEKVLYLTFDCGYENGYTAKILDVLKEKNVPAAFFCTLPQVKDYPDLIARMINEGHIVGNHSVKHPSFPSLTRTRMAEELKGMDDYLRLNFGYSEPYFRFPMGEYSDSALDLIGSLGYTSVFWSVAYSDWDLSNQKGKQYAFDTVTARLHPGAVILLHSVSPDNANALSDIIDWAKNEGYTFKSLRDYK